MLVLKIIPVQFIISVGYSLCYEKVGSKSTGPRRVRAMADQRFHVVVRNMSRGFEWPFEIHGTDSILVSFVSFESSRSLELIGFNLKSSYMSRFAEEFPMEPRVPRERLHLFIDGCEMMDIDTPRSLGLPGGPENGPSIIQVSLPR